MRPAKLSSSPGCSGSPPNRFRQLTTCSRLNPSSETSQRNPVEGAAKYLSMTEDAIRHKVMNGKLRAVRADRFLRFDVRDLDLWIESNKG
jgi:excisionase family DNA binding protein